jgi:hypothetical protein
VEDALGISKVNYAAYLRYLGESQLELLNVGVVKCARLRDQTQQAAVVLLLIRATSLFHSALAMLAGGMLLDAFDAVRRAYLETWLLAFDLRLEESSERATNWHAERGSSWSADIKRVENYLKSHSVELKLGRDYGGLSEVAHPTKAATINSAALAEAPFGGIAKASLIEARNSLEAEMPMMMYRYLWIVMEQREGLVPIGVDWDKMPTTVEFINEYAKTSRVVAS